MSRNLENLTSELVDCLRVDIASQRQTLELLEAQRSAIQEESVEGVEHATCEMVGQMRGMQVQDDNRQRLVKAFAEKFGVPVNSLTLSQVAQELGTGTDELLDARQELRKLSAEVIRANRRLSALVGTRKRIVTDVIDSLLQGPNGEARDQGVLLDAEA